MLRRESRSSRLPPSRLSSRRSSRCRPRSRDRGFGDRECSRGGAFTLPPRSLDLDLPPPRPPRSRERDLDLPPRPPLSRSRSRDRERECSRGGAFPLSIISRSGFLVGGAAGASSPSLSDSGLSVIPTALGGGSPAIPTALGGGSPMGRPKEGAGAVAGSSCFSLSMDRPNAPVLVASSCFSFSWAASGCFSASSGAALGSASACGGFSGTDSGAVTAGAFGALVGEGPWDSCSRASFNRSLRAFFRPYALRPLLLSSTWSSLTLNESRLSRVALSVMVK